MMLSLAYFKDSRGGFFIFLELLLVLAIIIFLVHTALKTYLNKPVLDKNSEKVLSGQGLDTTNYKTILDSTKGKVEDITRQHLDNLENLQ